MFVLGEALVLAEVLDARARDDERAATAFLGDAIVVGLPVEVLAVFDPAVSEGEKGRRVV